jgi:hypothetical protein
MLALWRWDPVIIAVYPPDENYPEYPVGRWVAVTAWWDEPEEV